MRSEVQSLLYFPATSRKAFPSKRKTPIYFGLNILTQSTCWYVERQICKFLTHPACLRFLRSQRKVKKWRKRGSWIQITIFSRQIFEHVVICRIKRINIRLVGGRSWQLHLSSRAIWLHVETSLAVNEKKQRILEPFPVKLRWVLEKAQIFKEQIIFFQVLDFTSRSYELPYFGFGYWNKRRRFSISNPCLRYWKALKATKNRFEQKGKLWRTS